MVNIEDFRQQMQAQIDALSLVNAPETVIDQRDLDELARISEHDKKLLSAVLSRIVGDEGYALPRDQASRQEIKAALKRLQSALGMTDQSRTDIRNMLELNPEWRKIQIAAGMLPKMISEVDPKARKAHKAIWDRVSEDCRFVLRTQEETREEPDDPSMILWIIVIVSVMAVICLLITLGTAKPEKNGFKPMPTIPHNRLSTGGRVALR